MKRLGLGLAGYIGTLALVALGVFLWTHHVERHVEHRIDKVVIQRRGDHEAIIALQHGEPAPGGDAEQTPSTGHQQPGPPGGGHQGNGGSHGSPTPHQPGSEHAPTPESPASHEASHHGPAAAAVEHVESVVDNTPAGPILESVGGATCPVLHAC